MVMFLVHHVVPFSSGNLVIVVGAQKGIPLVESLHASSPIVDFLRCGGLGVHGCAIVHFVHVLHCLYREEYQLFVCVRLLGGKSLKDPQGSGFERIPLLKNSVPFSGFEVIGAGIEKFRRTSDSIHHQ